MANFVVINSNAGERILNTDLILSITRYDGDNSIYCLNVIMVGKETFNFGFPNADVRDKYFRRLIGVSEI